jgi:hypothetical protein
MDHPPWGERGGQGTCKQHLAPLRGTLLVAIGERIQKCAGQQWSASLRPRPRPTRQHRLNRAARQNVSASRESAHLSRRLTAPKARRIGHRTSAKTPRTISITPTNRPSTGRSSRNRSTTVRSRNFTHPGAAMNNRNSRIAVRTFITDSPSVTSILHAIPRTPLHNPGMHVVPHN